MNKFSAKEYMYISIRILFIVLSLLQINEFVNYRKQNITALTKDWNKGIKSLYGTIKKTVSINDFNPKQISLKIFNSSPVILKFKPDSNIEFSTVTIFPENNKIIMKNNSKDIVLLDNVKLFTITPIDKNANETEDIARTCGFKFFFILLNNTNEIPIEFCVFSEYLFQKTLYPSFFDFIDNREFF